MKHSAFTASFICAWVAATPLFAATSVPAEPGAANVMSARRAGAPGFIRLETLPFSALLPAPPATDSIAAAADLETVLQVQGARTAEQVEWAKRVEKDDVFFNRDVIGPWFQAEKLPATAALFKALASDLRAVDAASKQPFGRPRPYQIDARVKPCVGRPTSSSYPSGSALQAFVWAHLLAEMIPAKREVLFARAERAAWGRVIGGVHFPTDIIAGRRLAEPFIAACRQNDAFRKMCEAARREIEAVANE